MLPNASRSCSSGKNSGAVSPPTGPESANDTGAWIVSKLAWTFSPTAPAEVTRVPVRGLRTRAVTSVSLRARGAGADGGPDGVLDVGEALLDRDDPVRHRLEVARRRDLPGLEHRLVDLGRLRLHAEL